MSDLVGNPEDRFSHNEAQLLEHMRLGVHALPRGYLHVNDNYFQASYFPESLSQVKQKYIWIIYGPEEENIRLR